MLISLIVIIVMNGLHNNNNKSEISTVVSLKNPYAYYIPWDVNKVKFLDLQPTISSIETATNAYYDSTIEERGYRNNDVPFECCCYLQQQQNRFVNISTGGNSSAITTMEEKEEEGTWLPLKKVFCATSYDEEIVYEYTIDFSKLQRLCKKPECHHRLWITSTSESGNPFTMKLNSGSLLSCGSREYASFCILLVVFLLLGFDYLSHTQTLILGIAMSFTLLSSVGRFPTAEKILDWLNASTIFFIVSMIFIVEMLKNINFFSWLAANIVRLTSSDPIRISVVLWISSCVFSAFFPTVPLMVFAVELALEVCEVLQMPSFYTVMGVVFMTNIGGSIFKFGSFLTISMSSDFDISFGDYFTNISFCTFVCALVIFLVVFIKFGIKIKDFPIKKIMWSLESHKKGSDDDDDYSSSGSESSDTSSDDDEYDIGIAPNGKIIHRSASGRSSRRKDGRLRLHKKLYLEDYKLSNPGFVAICAVFAFVFFVLFLLQDSIGIDTGICAIIVMLLLLILSSPFNPPDVLKNMDTSLVILTMLFIIFIGSLDELGLNNFTCK